MNNIRRISKDKYLEFSQYEGSQHIAKEHAIYRILEIANKKDVNNILEVGLGIGTIFSAVNQLDKKIHYSATENNEFCLNSLPLNLKEDLSKLNLYDNLDDVSSEVKYDLIIIDGKDPKTDKLKTLLANNGIVLIEGDRSDQEKEIKELFKKSISVHIITLWKNNPDGYFNGKDYQGGVKAIFINPTLKQKTFYIKHRILTKLKYTWRILKKK